MGWNSIFLFLFYVRGRINLEIGFTWRLYCPNRSQFTIILIRVLIILHSWTENRLFLSSIIGPYLPFILLPLILCSVIKIIIFFQHQKLLDLVLIIFSVIRPVFRWFLRNTSQRSFWRWLHSPLPIIVIWYDWRHWNALLFKLKIETAF